MRQAWQSWLGIGALLAALASCGCRGEEEKTMKSDTDFSGTRPAAVAGQFYTRDAAELRSQLAKFTGVKPPELPGRPHALIVPHAGYPYSGVTAGQAYAELKGATGFRRVVVLAPSHRVGFRGVSVGTFAQFATPLGEMPVDTEMCAKLAAASLLISTRADAHRGEHALEVQLPFLQTVAPDLKLVPVVCGQLSAEEVRSLAAVLRELLWNEETLWIVSSDFTHFGADFGYMPFTEDVPRRIRELDEGAIRCITKLDAGGFMEYIGRTGATICGAGPIFLLLATLEPVAGTVQATPLAYTTSGDLTQDWAHTVSYAAIAVSDVPAGKTAIKPAGTGVAAVVPVAAATTSAPETGGDPFSPQDKTVLLGLARETIAIAFRGGRAPAVDEAALSAALKADGACFVTLSEKNGALRGCIGHLEASEPLWRNVIRNARNAAFSDSRFFPVTAEELPNLRVEISVLTPAKKIASLDEFVIGRHGIILEKGRNRSVFLPQVAPEQGWDKDTTLTHLALKAGLSADAWRTGATFYTFEAIVFHEMK